MSDWEVVDDGNGSDWEATDSIQSAIDEQQKNYTKHPFLHGLGQFAEDFIVGSAEDTRGAEPEFPEHWKPEKIRKENRPETSHPTLGLEKNIDPNDMTEFNLGRYAPHLATLGLGTAGAVRGAAGLTNRSVGNRIVNFADDLQERFRQRFGEVFDQAAQGGVRTVTRRPITLNRLHDFGRIAQANERHKLQDFLNDPTLENAHWAQSDLGGFIRRMEKEPRNQSINEAITAAREMREGILNSIRNQFEHRNLGDIYDRYQHLRNEYRTDMAPFRNSKAIHNARLDPSEENFMEPYRLPSELGGRKGDSFRRMVGDEFPELSINRLLATPTTWLKKLLERS